MTPHVSTTLLRTQTDQRLIELIAAGHDRAFDAIVDRYRRPLLRYARRFLHEDARAEDVVQSAFVSAWTALNEGATVRDLRPWLYRIVHNGALNVMKKPGRDDAILIEASDLRPGPAAEVEQREEVRQALDTISRLPERQRTALLAVAFDGRSHADVGAELGLKEPAVRQLVSRARTTLRVAATAVTPWPVATWIAGIGGPAAGDTAARAGEIAGGVGAGTVFGGGALKAGALVAAAGAVAVSAPRMAQVTHHHAHKSVATASASTASSSQRAGHASAGTPAASANPGSGAASFRVVSSGAGGLTAGVRVHSRSGGGASGGWSRRTHAKTPVTTWTPGGSGDTSAGTTAPAVTDTPRGDRHAGSEDSGRRWSGSTQQRSSHHRGSGTGDDRIETTVTQSGDSTSGSVRRDSSGGDSGGSSLSDRVEQRDAPSTSTSGGDSGSGSTSDSSGGSDSSGTPESGDSHESGDATAPAPAPAPQN